MNDAVKALIAKRAAEEKAYIIPLMHDSQYQKKQQSLSEPLPGQGNQ